MLQGRREVIPIPIDSVEDPANRCDRPDRAATARGRRGQEKEGGNTVLRSSPERPPRHHDLVQHQGHAVAIFESAATAKWCAGIFEEFCK
jgi:hypothetical protein